MEAYDSNHLTSPGEREKFAPVFVCGKYAIIPPKLSTMLHIYYGDGKGKTTAAMAGAAGAGP